MTADLLQRAADRARSIAQAADACRPRPWTARNDTHPNGTRTSVHNGQRHVTGYAAPDVVDHIVLWQPAVAAAVAAWLSDVARTYRTHEPVEGMELCEECNDLPECCDCIRHPLAVALALLAAPEVPR